MWSGALYRALRKKGVFSDDRDLGFCCGFDGTKAFKTRKDRFVWPVILTCLNLPPEMRFKRKNVLIAGFVPGPKNPKDVDSFLKPMVDEFEILTNGIKEVYDAGSVGRNKEFTLRAHLVLVTTDMPARKKILNTMGLASSSYCEYCTIKGLQYGGIHCPHKPPTNLPDAVKDDQKKRRDENRPCYNWKRDYTCENALIRTDEKFREIADWVSESKDEKFAERTGISGKSCLAVLPTIFFPASFPPCTMHLFYENVAPVMFEHFAGRFLVKRHEPVPGQSDKDLNGDAVGIGDPAGPTGPTPKENSDPTNTMAAQPQTAVIDGSVNAVRRRKGEPTYGAPAFKQRKGTDAPFLENDDPYNIHPTKWRQIGADTERSNSTYPNQLGEEMTNLLTSFRKMKAANWQRFVFHQSPIYFRKCLPKIHYDN